MTTSQAEPEVGMEVWLTAGSDLLPGSSIRDNLVVGPFTDETQLYAFMDETDRLWHYDATSVYTPEGYLDFFRSYNEEEDDDNEAGS